MKTETIAINDNLIVRAARTDKFKTVELDVQFVGKLDPSLTSDSLVLTRLLSDSCAKYPTRQALSAYLEYLYDAQLSVAPHHHMEEDRVSFGVNFIAPRYLPADFHILEKVFALLSEIIYHPLVKDGAFSAPNFDVVKNNALVMYRNMEAHKRAYAIAHLYDYLKEDHPYKYPAIGTYEGIKNVDRVSVYKAYRALLERPIEVFIAGDIDLADLKKAVEKYLIPGDRRVVARRRIPLPFNGGERFEVEKNFKQSQLTMVFNLPEIVTPRDGMVASLFNYLFGGAPASALFLTIREQYDYCYEIDSLVQALSSTIIVSMGIDATRAEDCEKLTLLELKKIANGEIAENAFQEALKSIETSFAAIADSPASLIIDFFNCLFDYGRYVPAEERIKEMKSVTEQEISDFAKKIKFSYSFLLKQGGEQ